MVKEFLNGDHFSGRYRETCIPLINENVDNIEDSQGVFLTITQTPSFADKEIQRTERYKKFLSDLENLTTEFRKDMGYMTPERLKQLEEHGC